jgi:hypothetical protein
VHRSSELEQAAFLLYEQAATLHRHLAHGSEQTLLGTRMGKHWTMPTCWLAAWGKGHTAGTASGLYHSSTGSQTPLLHRSAKHANQTRRKKSSASL